MIVRGRPGAAACGTAAWCAVAVGLRFGLGHVLSGIVFRRELDDLAVLPRQIALRARSAGVAEDRQVHPPSVHRTAPSVALSQYAPPVKLGLAALAVVVLIPGCSDAASSAGPGTLAPVAPTSAVPSASVTAVPPVTPTAPPLAPVEKPALADEATAAGAEAFARYWIAVLNQAYQTLDPSELDQISASECTTCQAYSSSMRRAAGDRERWVGGLTKVSSAVATPVQAGTSLVLIGYDADAFTAYDRFDAVLDKQAPQEDGTIKVVAQRKGGMWLAREVTQQ